MDTAYFAGVSGRWPGNVARPQQVGLATHPHVAYAHQIKYHEDHKLQMQGQLSNLLFPFQIAVERRDFLSLFAPAPAHV